MFHFSLVAPPQSFSLDHTKIQDILVHIEKTLPIPQKGILSIACISDEEMRTLNHTYRGKNATTDVLSFHYLTDFGDASDSDIVGECVFSESKIIAQAHEYGHTPEEEFLILWIHSVLHILGFDHELDEDFHEMWKFEEGIRAHFGLSLSR